MRHYRFALGMVMELTHPGSSVIPEVAGRLIGLDLGSRRIGVAVCDSGWSVASGIAVITRSKDRQADHRAIASLVDEYEAVGVIVGIPFSLDGSVGPAAAAAAGEVEVLRSGLRVPLDTIDERLTTVAASSALRAGGKTERRQRSLIDQTAAAVLLQTWIDRSRREVR